MMLLVLIFITCFFKSQERVYAAEMEVECVLHKVEICNICWHDFNSELCPHTKGVIYGGNECKTYDEKYCGLCGAKIGECEHEVGKIYGGEECTTTDKMMCSVCNDWYRDCCHIVGREYKNIVYYFYMDSRFDKVWNSLGMYDEKDCNIYSLIMNMHGTPTEIFSDVGSSPMRMSIQDVEKLKTKPVQRLVLLQCSVGKIEKAGNNIASAFARAVTGKVLAGDGVVNQNEVRTKEYENSGDTFYKDNQNIFVRYYVDDEGWYIYKHDWNERIVKYTYAAPNGKMYRLYQLINMLDI